MIELKSMAGGEAEYARIRQDVVKVVRQNLRRAVDARPQSVMFTQGTYDAIVRAVPMMIGDAVTRAVLLERALERVSTISAARIDQLEAKVAALEARLLAAQGPTVPAKADDDHAGKTVVAFSGMRGIAAA